MRPVLAAAVLAPLALALAAGGCRSLAAEGGPFRRVRPTVAFEMILDSPDLPILDLRPADEHHGPLGHLEGARSFPLADLPRRYLEILELRDETFLVYCRADECEPQAMDFLGAHGFEDAMLIDGGIEAWIAEGFQTVGAGAPPEHVDEPPARRPAIEMR
ncbi:MAG TPA: rhodanese-like domain-containing protein [Thermoanaerobaculia bacterium]|nr:rhodanese-like domain-containing protein [Thermoanaerobaculia bacterium]